jgi:ubiquinone/menaquinone biosynthesis C-methylase UbiE
LRVCGIDSYLHIGCGQSTLVFELLKRSIDAYGMDPSRETIKNNLERAPDRFFEGSLTNFPFNQTTFGTVIIGAELFTFGDDGMAAVLKALQSITKNNLVLYFPPDTMQQYTHRQALMKRLFWEQAAIQADFRRHPRSMLITPYQELEDERLGRLLFFEKIPPAAQTTFTLDWLQKHRDLRQDRLREAGRRADSDISRYVLAAMKIRPGDVVLDTACGLGYGTAVLAACSPGSRFIGIDKDPDAVAYAEANFMATNSMLSYRAADVTAMSFLADHSVDTVIALETMAHLQDYDRFLKEVRRVLKPDGRFIGSVPNRWCDPAGKKPEPPYCQVFDWDKLQQAIATHFIVDERWAQIAGGGSKLANGKRILCGVPLDFPSEIDTEWWIISACANPLTTASVTFANPFHKEGNLAPLHVAFEKYYDNPWLYRIMVQLGERLTDRQVLANFCSKIAVEARAGSADQGAALCVLCYQLLESGNVTLTTTNKLIECINQYDAAYDHSNPHAFRWAMSLHYVAARLLLALGKRQDAKTVFLTCAAMDPLQFSPLLATKTVSSRMYAGLLFLSDNDLERAKEQLRLGIREAHRVLQGNWETILGMIDQPLPFGLQEAAEVLDIAGQCAQVLHAIDREGSAAGFIWDKVNLKRFGLVEWNKSLERENNLLRQQHS